MYFGMMPKISETQNNLIGDGKIPVSPDFLCVRLFFPKGCLNIKIPANCGDFYVWLQ